VTAFRYAAAAKDREPSRLLVDLTTDFGELQSALTTCRSTVQLRLITRVAAQLSGLMCLTLIKLDERQAFRRWARTARLAAAEVNDSTTTAWVLAQEAYGHFYGHDIAEAVSVAQQAQDVAGRSVGSALAAALEARAHAVRGDPKQTHKALAQAGLFCCFRGSVRGRCAGCGAAPPRSRAPVASLMGGRCAPPLTCEPLRPLRAGRAGRPGPARSARSAPEPRRAGGRW
jgi:hypothetical protein